MMKTAYIFIILFMLLSSSCHCKRHDSSQKEEQPEYVYLGEITNDKIKGQSWKDDGKRTVFIRGGDVIPNAKIAADVAKTILIHAFGEEIYESHLPLQVELENDSIWIFSGTLSEGSLGGTYHMNMLKWNGQVTAIWGEQ